LEYLTKILHIAYTDVHKQCVTISRNGDGHPEKFWSLTHFKWNDVSNLLLEFIGLVEGIRAYRVLTVLIRVEGIRIYQNFA